MTVTLNDPLFYLELAGHCLNEAYRCDSVTGAMGLRKLAQGYDAGDRLAAMNHIATHQARGEILTGLLYVDVDAADLHSNLATTDRPLNSLGVRDLCPGAAALEALQAELR